MKSEAALWHLNQASYAGYGGSPVSYGSISSPNLAANVIWSESENQSSFRYFH